MKKQYNKNLWFVLGITFLICSSLILIVLFNSKVDVSGSLDCNSGKVDLKYEQSYREVKLPDFSGSFINITNQTKFQDVPLYLKFNGIDNLNCKSSFHVKGNPIIFNLVYGGKNEK